MMKRIYVCNVKIQIEKTLLKAKGIIKENVKTSKYLNRQSQQMNLRYYSLIRKNHECIYFCSLLSG